MMSHSESAGATGISIVVVVVDGGTVVGGTVVGAAVVGGVVGARRRGRSSSTSVVSTTVVSTTVVSTTVVGAGAPATSSQVTESPGANVWFGNVTVATRSMVSSSESSSMFIETVVTCAVERLEGRSPRSGRAESSRAEPGRRAVTVDCPRRGVGDGVVGLPFERDATVGSGRLAGGLAGWHAIGTQPDERRRRLGGAGDVDEEPDVDVRAGLVGGLEDQEGRRRGRLVGVVVAAEHEPRDETTDQQERDDQRGDRAGLLVPRDRLLGNLVGIHQHIGRLGRRHAVDRRRSPASASSARPCRPRPE